MLKQRWPILIVGLLTALAFGLRLHQYGLSLLGDELSTLWIVENHDLGGTLQTVAGDAEITPPLYFVLAWFATKFGSAPELVRLPALISGTACVPLIYLLGLRTVGRIPGLFSAALMTLSPFMIFFSGSGRAYTLLLALLIGSTLAMLAAARTGRIRWWVAYGLLSCLAVYSHYTAAFVLLAQFIWLLWAEPEARRPAAIANIGAALLFLPWLPSMLDDTDSPTVALLEALQGQGFEVKRQMVEQWAIGHPLLAPAQLPGRAAAIVIAVAVLVAALAAAAREFHRRPGTTSWIREHRMAILVLALALATPLAEAVYALLGTDLFGSRNLVASSSGLMLVIGSLVTAAGPVWGGVCGLAVIGGFSVGAVKTVESGAATFDYISAADRIEAESGSDDIVVDLLLPPVTPAPLTPLDAHLDDTVRIYSLNQPEGDPPFLPLTPKPDPGLLLNKALDAGRDGTVFVVGLGAEVTVGKGSRATYENGNIRLPRGWRVDGVSSYPGALDLEVTEVTRKSGG